MEKFINTNVNEGSSDPSNEGQGLVWLSVTK